MKRNRFLLAGFAILSMGMAMVSCSSTDVYDENYAQDAENSLRIAKYEQAFTQAFGQVNKNHRWGFDQTTGIITREAVTAASEAWDIPENLWGGAQNKEGWNANDLDEEFRKRANNLANTLSYTLSDFDFNNYFLQHVEQPDGGNIKNSIIRLEAFNSSPGVNAWETVTNFADGKNNSTFTIDANSTYYYGNINRSAFGTTLMVNMGGDVDKNDSNSDSYGKMFRVVYDDGTYNYNYTLVRTRAYHKDFKKYIDNEPFLAFQFPPKNAQKDPSYWVIRLGVAQKLEEPVEAEGRVLCEDMGANDFDFNDVVFDAWLMKNGDLKIKILAHGGELDISVAGVLVTLDKMSNTGYKEDTSGGQEFTLKKGEHNITSIASIPVVVYPNGYEANNLNNNCFPLEAIQGKIPQKICVPINTLWPDEFIKISSAYSTFPTWVTERDPARWTYRAVPRLVDLNLGNNNPNTPTEDELITE